VGIRRQAASQPSLRHNRSSRPSRRRPLCRAHPAAGDDPLVAQSSRAKMEVIMRRRHDVLLHRKEARVPRSGRRQREGQTRRKRLWPTSIRMGGELRQNGSPAWWKGLVYLNSEMRSACSRISLALSAAIVPVGSPLYMILGLDQKGMRGHPPQFAL
jgi:hypothetical protein